MEKPSKKYELNKVDLKKLGKSFLLALGGTACVWALDILTQIDFGPAYTPALVGLGTFGINFIRKWLAGKK